MKINSREQKKNIQFLDIITKGKTSQFNDDHQHITEIKKYIYIYRNFEWSINLSMHYLHRKYRTE